MSRPLSNPQKARLVQLARAAYTRAMLNVARGPGGENFDTWRRRVIFELLGKEGLRECGDEDFGALKAHFLQLAGDDAGAMNAHIEARQVVKRRAAWRIGRCLKALGKPMAYAEAIARRQFQGRGVDELSDGEAVQLAMTLSQNERRAKRAKRAAINHEEHEGHEGSQLSTINSQLI